MAYTAWVLRRAAIPVLLALGLLLSSGSAAAQTPIDSADRPGRTTPTTIVPKGMLQVESGVEFERVTADHEPNKTTITLPDLLLRVGITDRFEARLRADGLLYEVRDQLRDRALGSDLVLGAKLRLFSQHGLIPETALLGELSFPVGSDPVTSGGFDPRLDGLYEWKLVETLSLLLNTGFAWPTQGRRDSRRIFEFDPRASFNWQVTPRIGAFAEYYGEVKTGRVADEHSIDGGITWLVVAKRVQLDLSAGAGLNEAAPEWFVSAGISMRFGVFAP